MYRDRKVAMVIPAYNEEKLITKTVETLPDFVDLIIVVNDGSSDRTQEVLDGLKDGHKKLEVLTNNPNRGLGYSLVRGYKEVLKREDIDIIGTLAGDAQCDPDYLSKMCDMQIDGDWDYVKANRFTDLSALRAMPPFRRVGNIVISLLNKFSTGYYSIFDSQNGYGVFKRSTLEQVPFELVGERYDYENTMLLAMGVINGRVKDIAVPAIYGDEVSTIKFFPVMRRALSVLFKGFWKRIYYKYVIFNFHPLALFLFSGMFLALAGFGFGLYLTIERVFLGAQPSSGTVMLSVLPLLLGVQLILTAIVMDVNNENRQ